VGSSSIANFAHLNFTNSTEGIKGLECSKGCWQTEKDFFAVTKATHLLVVQSLWTLGPSEVEAQREVM